MPRVPSVWVNIKDEHDKINLGSAQPKPNQWFSLGENVGIGLLEIITDGSYSVATKARFALTVVDNDMNIKSYDDQEYVSRKKSAEADRRMRSEQIASRGRDYSFVTGSATQISGRR